MREVAGFDEGVGGGACGSVYKAGLCMVVKRMKEKNKNKKGILEKLRCTKQKIGWLTELPKKQTCNLWVNLKVSPTWRISSCNRKKKLHLK